MIILSTERLILREFKISDAQVMYDLNSDEEVMRYTGDVYFKSLEESEQLITNYSDYERNGFGRWAVIRKEDNEMLGWCGLKKHKDNSVDVGYRFFKKHWNQGYATESARACLEYGFNVIELEEIVANADPENVASVRVMEKIGMNFQYNQDYDGMENAVRYKILKNEFH